LADVNAGCIDLIHAGDFEAFNPAWQIQVGSRPPAYSNQQTFNSSAYAMRIGNDLALPDVESVSEVRHASIALPYGATSLILRFVYWPQKEVAADNDLQQVDLFDATTDQLIASLLTVRDDARQWKAVDYDLTSYAGRQVSLRFRVRNDGQPGRTLMYIDNVEIEYCAATAVPTYTPTQVPVTTVTPVTTFTPTATGVPAAAPATATPIVAATPTTVIPTADPTCANILLNGGFESWDGWQFGDDPVPGRYVAEPRRSGARAIQLGNPPAQGPNVVTFSSIRQLVTLPYNITRAEVRWWKLLQTADGGVAGSLSDRQDLILLSPALQPIQILSRELSNTGNWQEDQVDITAYRGQSFYLYFNAFNDGNGARTWMYLDDIQLNLCGMGAIEGDNHNTPIVATPVVATPVVATPVIATPIAIPLTTVATFTTAPIPTSSPLPTQLVLPTATLPAAPTAIDNAPAALPMQPPAATETPTVLPLEQSMPTTNVNALATLPTSLAVSRETPNIILVPDSSVATVEPPATTTVADATTGPQWLGRVGPIAVLVSILVLIGFIVWAILRTFHNSRAP